MNILAHLALSGDSPGIRFGNFIGDAVKGNAYLQWDQPFRAGLQLHRFIDWYVDQHPEALAVRRDLAKELGLYAPVALDILFDHALSLCWEEFHSFDRETFIGDCYMEIEQNQELIPDEMHLFTRAMIEHDWLNAYSTGSGIHRALHGLSTRAKGRPDLVLGLKYFQNERKKVLSHFRKFYPDLQQQCEHKRMEFLNGID